jgi:putative membrane protein
VLLQAALVYATVVWGLRMRIAEPALFTLTLLLSSVTFLAIVLALTRLLGDAGKAASMIFLAVQLSSSGGILPVELSGTLFSEISPWLPLTWVVRAMKISMFGAYGGEWQHPMVIISCTCLIGLMSACWLGRWRYVRPSALRPAVDF